MAGKKELSFTGERLINGIEGFIKLEHLHRYALALELVKNKVVLDIGCGDGYGSNLIAEHANEVFAMDIDKITINHAKASYKKVNLKFVEGDIRSIKFPDRTFDVVVCFETLEHVEEHFIVLSEFKRILKPNGLLIMSTPDKTNYSEASNHVNPYHKRELNFAEYNELLTSFFTCNHFLFQFPIVASFILNPVNSHVQFYNGNYSKTIQNVPPLIQYIISISSDKPIQNQTTSVFYESLLKNVIINSSDNSIELKLAKLILKPIHFFNKLRKWLSNQQNLKNMYSS